MVAHLAAEYIMDRAGLNPIEKVDQQIDMELNVNIDYGECDEN